MPTIELVPVSALHPAPYNPREADTERLELVALSLRKLGFLLPLVATKDGEILSGHQRHRMAAAMGASRVPVLHADIQGAKRRGLNILFNRATNDISVQDTEQDMITALHDADVEALAAELPDIPTDSPDFYPCMTAELREVRPLAQMWGGCWHDLAFTFLSSSRRTVMWSMVSAGWKQLPAKADMK